MSKYLYTELPDADAHRRRVMKAELEHLTEYCARRATGDHCPQTTITVLKRKVVALEMRVRGAGVARSIAPSEEWSPSGERNELP